MQQQKQKRKRIILNRATEMKNEEEDDFTNLRIFGSNWTGFGFSLKTHKLVENFDAALSSDSVSKGLRV